MNKYAEKGLCAGVGVVGGGLDQFFAELDIKNAAESAEVKAGKSFPIWRRLGFYLNYIAPATIAILSGADVIKDGMLGGAVLAEAGHLVARKGVHDLTVGPKKQYTEAYVATPAKYSRDDWALPARSPARQEIPTSSDLRGSTS